MAFPVVAAFLASAVGPLAKKVLIALGFGVVSYGGLAVLYSSVQSQVVSSFGQLGGATLQIISLAGFPQAVGIILSALAARVALLAAKKLALLAS